MPHLTMNRLPVRMNEVASNQACDPRDSVQYARVHYQTQTGKLLPAVEVDLGKKMPEDLSVAEVMKWAHKRIEDQGLRAARLSERRIVAFAREQLCDRAKHVGQPATPNLSARLERVGGVLVASAKAVPFAAHLPFKAEQPADGVGFLNYSEKGLVAMQNTIFLPAHTSLGDRHRIHNAIELHSLGFSTIHGALHDAPEGFLEDVAYYDQLWGSDGSEASAKPDPVN